MSPAMTPIPAKPPITDPTITGVLFDEDDEGDAFGFESPEPADTVLWPVETAGLATPDGISR